MSRTYKDMPKTRNKRWRVLENAMYKKVLHCYGEDIIGRRKDTSLNGIIRARLKKESDEEILWYQKNKLI